MTPEPHVGPLQTVYRGHRRPELQPDVCPTVPLSVLVWSCRLLQLAATQAVLTHSQCWFVFSPILPTAGAHLRSSWRWWNFILDKHLVSFERASAAATAGAAAALLFWAGKAPGEIRSVWGCHWVDLKAYLEISWIYAHDFRRVTTDKQHKNIIKHNIKTISANHGSILKLPDRLQCLDLNLKWHNSGSLGSKQAIVLKCARINNTLWF